MKRDCSYVGRLPGGDRLYVQIVLREQEGKGRLTVRHEPAPDPYVELSVTGEVYAKGRREPWTVGQTLWALAELVQSGEPEWDEKDAAALLILWKRWHLNGIQPWCAHMPEDVRGRPYGEVAHVTCPMTWYRYGTAWLVEPLPEAVEAKIRALISKYGPEQTHQ